ncbi:MAG: helix-turn-helix transcriptional regulator [Clostridia bacterium]|nr:helix-turn-helix transcriptional regulator [Clostridia bacterium]MBR3991357.1 helix-turn-helix transcriptional regulator [Clostridia bacterium]
MNDIKTTVAKNITELRLLNNMTQAELGEKLNYSDKTVSKWERAESTPDISVLCEIADLFGVTVDYLVSAENVDENYRVNKREEVTYNRRVITYISESAAWVSAIFAFIITTLIIGRMSFQWLYLVYAVPVVLIIALVFNSVWFNPRNNYVIISGLMWSILCAVHLTFFYFRKSVLLIYLLGAAGQIVIILWSFIKKPKKR